MAPINLEILTLLIAAPADIYWDDMSTASRIYPHFSPLKLGGKTELLQQFLQ
jgi:hypothetical protein